MHRAVVACLSAAALSFGTLAFAGGGAGVANAAPRAVAGIPLTGLWEVQIPHKCGSSCETIKFDTTNKTFTEHDTHGFKDHGSYSLGHHVLNLLWTGGKNRGIAFEGTYRSAMDEFVGTYTLGGITAKGDLIAIK